MKNGRVAKNIVMLVLILLMLSNCVYISSGNKIKLNNSSDISNNTLNKVSLSYQFVKLDKKDDEEKYIKFLPIINDGQETKAIEEFSKNVETKCIAKVYGKIRKVKSGTLKNLYRNISGITFEILPFFWINSNYAKLRLVENKRVS